ncbi:MAG TPA: DUF72 domain-containing protein [Candidatus Brocadiia bacterium]|nr:DUF72 domain-containing protein [Candidatus Brocadiia bacterium]
MANTQGTLRIGTCGYTYEHWRDVFYPADLPPSQWLEFYAKHFNSLELKATFYHTTSDAMAEKWRQSTPPTFLFSSRASKVITHNKMLRGCGADLSEFRSSLIRLGAKLGPVMWQLPSGLRADIPRLSTFLRVVTQTWRTRHAVEFRHATWLVPEVEELLAKHNVALVNADMPRARVVEKATADFVYLRRHGPRGSNRKAYSDRSLHEDAECIGEWRKQGKDVFVYFNNNVDGLAVRNALRLRDICGA